MPSGPQTGEQIGKVGTVVATASDGLLIEFLAERCENCSCAAGLTNGSSVLALHPQVLEPATADSADLYVGQLVKMHLPAARLQLVSVALFGVPVLFALLGCLGANLLAMETSATADLAGVQLVSGIGALGGFMLGALANLRIGRQLQTGLYERLTVVPWES